MKMTPVVVVVSFLLLLLTWLPLSGLNLNSTRFDQQLEALDQFSRLERALNREVLTARAGLSRNYDTLARLTDAYDESVHQLRRAAGSDAEERAAIEVLSAGAHRQQALIEQFKSRNALLRNSFLYFGIFSARLAASDRTPVVAAATTLSAAMLHLTLDTSPAAARDVKARLEQLAALPNPGDDTVSIQAAIAHGGVLHDLLPATDAALKALIAAATTREQDAVRALIMDRQFAARAKARQYRLLLYATSLLLLGALVYLGLQLRARAIALQRRAAFEHVIAGVSMRFINAQPHNIDAGIARALADMAECIGSDRAYFVSSGAAPRQHIWCRPGISSPPDWPQRAMALTARFEPSADGLSMFRASTACRSARTRRPVSRLVLADGHARPLSTRTVAPSSWGLMRLDEVVVSLPPANSACCAWRLIRSCMRWSGIPWKRNARGWRCACSRPAAWRQWGRSAAVLPITSTISWPASLAIPRWWRNIAASKPGCGAT